MDNLLIMYGLPVVFTPFIPWILYPRLPQLRILPCSEGAACNPPDIQLSSPRFNLKKPANRIALWIVCLQRRKIESILLLRSGKLSSYLSNVCNSLLPPAALKNWTPEKCLRNHRKHQQNLLYWVKSMQWPQFHPFSLEIQQLSLSLVYLSSNDATLAKLSARISHVCHNLINLPQLDEALDHLLMNLSPQVDGEGEPQQDAIDSIRKLRNRLNT